MMKVKAVAFDLGGTLVQYYQREEFPAILKQAIENVYTLISSRISVPLKQAQEAALKENKERPDGKVCPLHERLERIFCLSQPLPPAVKEGVALAFLTPIFSCARKYDDADPVLLDLRNQGYYLAIVSNTTWGTPSGPWRDELRRLGLSQAVDLLMFCVDVGWRKPAPQIFKATSKELGIQSEECVFVGDHPQWDYDGSGAAGMIPVLIAREHALSMDGGYMIRTLSELPGLLKGF